MKEESKCAYVCVCVRVCIEGSFIIRVTYYEAIVDQQIPELLLLKHLEKEQTLRKAALGGEWEEGVSRCDMPDSHMSFFLSFFLSPQPLRSAVSRLDLHDKFRILRLLPVLEILQIIEERCVGKVLVLSQICNETQRNIRLAQQARETKDKRERERGEESKEREREYFLFPL